VKVRRCCAWRAVKANERLSHRDPFPDALRALALLGVLVINAAGYLDAPWGPVLGDETAREGGATLALQGLYAFGVQGKAYPVLAFLFGMGLVLAQRPLPASQALDRARRRQKWLLLLGLMHGVFIYFGDILTAYALIGWLLLNHVRMPWSRLRKQLRRAMVWALVVTAGTVALTGLWWTDGSGTTADTGASFATVTNLSGFWSLNATAYLVIQLGTLILGFPLFRLLMLAGIAAARLRWLTHPRWKGQRQRLLRYWAWPALLLNAAFGTVRMLVAGDEPSLGMVEMLGYAVGPLLSMVMVTALAQHAARAPWLLALAPLGQRTLTLYIGHGLLCMLLFSGTGLGWKPDLGGMLMFSLMLWGLAWLLAKASRRQRWPLEAWLARVAHR
jgi:uncharacterized protein